MSCGIFPLHAWPRGRRSRLRHRSPRPLLHVFCHPSPKKESKPGMDGALMSSSLRSIPPGLLSQFTSCPALGVIPRRETRLLCPSERFIPNLGPCPRIRREPLVL